MNYLAFDVGGTYVKYAVVTREGEILIKDKFSSPKESFDDLVRVMGQVHCKLKEEYHLGGIALSVPGAPDNETGFIIGNSALPYLHGPNVHATIQKETGLPVISENDGKSAALCEVWRGAARDVQDAIFIILGTGVGGAIVKDKKVHQGANLLAGEFGYIINNYSFNNNHFEILANQGSTGCLVRDVARKRGIASEKISGEEIFQDAQKGDIHCIEAIEKFYESIAVSIFSLMYIYNPEKIILGGAISSRPELPDKINEKLQIIKTSIANDLPQVDPPIVPCQYKGDANLLGATYNFIQKEEKLK